MNRECITLLGESAIFIESEGKFYKQIDDIAAVWNDNHDGFDVIGTIKIDLGKSVPFKRLINTFGKATFENEYYRFETENCVITVESYMIRINSFYKNEIIATLPRDNSTLLRIEKRR